ncbi:MAG: HAD family hydrolase [Lachnospiraceae bacterium]
MEYILLDLDGTITNPKEGITKSFQYALHHFGIDIDDLDSLCKHIGPPLIDSFMECYGFDEEKAKLAAAKYRERFTVEGWLENEVYPGMEEALQRLKEAGKVLIVATSKPEHLAVKILEHFGLDGYFDDICGASDDKNRSKKDEVIRYVLEKHELRDLSDVIMVGDRKYDIIGAKKCGLASMGVLYGFGNRREFEEAGADYVAETVEEMAQLLVSL